MCPCCILSFRFDVYFELLSGITDDVRVMTLMLDRALKSPETLFHLVYSSNDEKVLGFPTRRAMRSDSILWFCAFTIFSCLSARGGIMSKLWKTVWNSALWSLFYCSLLVSNQFFVIPQWYPEKIEKYNLKEYSRTVNVDKKLRRTQCYWFLFESFLVKDND